MLFFCGTHAPYSTIVPMKWPPTERDGPLVVTREWVRGPRDALRWLFVVLGWWRLLI